MTSRRTSEAGIMATQLAVLMPALLVLVMLAVQFALWAHATQLADAAADMAAATAALPDATDDDGRSAAAALLAQAGNLNNADVEVRRDMRQVTATVTGVAPHLVPGFRWSVTAHAAAPLELFIQEAAR